MDETAHISPLWRRVFAGLGEGLKAIGPSRAAIVLGVAVGSAFLILLFQYFLGSKTWEWGELFANIVSISATAFVIVGLLEWSRQRRWRLAEEEDQESIVRLALLVATFEESPLPWTVQGKKTPTEALQGEIDRLENYENGLKDASAALTSENDLTADLQILRDVWFVSPTPFEVLERYSALGARRHRLHYLSDLISLYLPGLMARRDDPVLYREFVALRASATQAILAADRTDAVIFERVLVRHPPHLSAFIKSKWGSAVFFEDRVSLLARLATVAWERRVKVISSESFPGDKPDFRSHVGFAADPIAAIEEEVRQIRQSVHALLGVVAILERTKMHSGGSGRA
jgi:hypothetical protein